VASEWNLAVIGASIRDHHGRGWPGGVPYGAFDMEFEPAASPFKDR
jgi:hypothetical protein